ncbi:adenylate/guanylate cyclase domain-containing protein [Ferrovibrio terrae]|uniref:Adenylate/guanylate cyclase domain-containing protein n=1 Tax=Ferrovibrio terrae TaxID=2594003 RepID=A0A516GZB6_9PROT|nr:adenylate/guanylate cyclase domain-containing protein [Ferrovibrio terrae]QDO96876.1 adenylate/guanylate cyclase domain-containing protein [Ferrovibrio terrae]
MAAGARFEEIYSRTKLASGLVLFTFLATHLINHTFGIVSLQAMDAGSGVFKFIWRSWPGTVLLYTAAITHPLLALFNWLRRGHYRGIQWQGWMQLALGVCVPPLVVDHVIGTRGLHEALGVNDTYAYVLIVQFVQEPLIGLRQNILILIAWGHGCFGVYYWLRLKAVSERVWPFLFGAALLLPMLATMGYLSAGRAVLLAMQQPEWMEAFRASLNWPGPAANDFGMRNVGLAYQTMIGLLGLGLFGRLLAAALRRRRGIVTVSYPDGRKFRGLAGSLTVLEASRAIGYPHASVCGGQGRCSTCRVRLSGAGAADLSPPDAAEQKVLDRVKASPGVRLACQVRPQGDVAVLPLLPAGVQSRIAYGNTSYAQGSERRIAILFADLRGFTKLSEGKLPYDVVFVLNQYFKAMGEAVDGAGGKLDKFIGDGVMALFGIDEGPDEGCRRALDAARRMAAALVQLNDALKMDLDQKLRIGIGIHCGPAIVGEMGHGSAMHLTAVGDAVNTASRLETATKDFGAELVISAEVADRAGAAAMAGMSWQRESVALRGKSENIEVLVAGHIAPAEAGMSATVAATS